MIKMDIKDFSKNKKMLYLLFFLLTGVFFISRYFLISSDPYNLVLEVTKSHSIFQYKIGKEISVGFWVTGRINHLGDNSAAFFNVPVTGENGKGTIEAFVVKSKGEWQISRLNLLQTNKNEIILKK